MCLHIAAEIASSALLGRPIEGTVEVVARGYMVAMAFLPLALIQRRDGHIKAEIFTAALSDRALRRLAVLADVLMLAFAGFFAWYSLLDAVAATRSREAVELMSGVLVVWPTRWLPALGFAAAALVALVDALARVTRPAR